MKKVLLFITLLIVSVSIGQTIMVNGNPMLVDDQTSFPFWLESGSTISAETSVSAISVIEFNIKSNDDGNDMVFNQVLSITSESSVPNNKVWKVESVLKDDPNFNSESDSSGVFDDSDVISSNQSISGVPVGTILSFAGTTAPEGFLICDGSIISSSVYSELFSVIGNIYGDGDGSYTLEWLDSNNDEIMDPEEMVNVSSTFNLPNLNGRTIIGFDITGNTVANADSLGNYGGEELHTLTIEEMPSHNHEIQSFSYQSNSGYKSGYQFFSDGNNRIWNNSQTANKGGDLPHNNMQPYLVTNYIIKY